MTEIYVEKLLGRPVFDTDGKSVGRIEEIVIEKSGRHYQVAEFHLGTAAFLERVGTLAMLFFKGPGQASGVVAGWDQVDLRDPRRVMLTCPASELKRLKS